MILNYTFYSHNGNEFDFEFEVESYYVDLAMTKGMGVFTQDEWTIMSDEEQEREIELAEYELTKYFEADAYEDFKESRMDVYDFHGVSRKDFF
jgi:hypothetical protein